MEKYFEDLERRISSSSLFKKATKHKTTMIFEINIVKLIDKCPELMMPSVPFFF